MLQEEMENGDGLLCCVQLAGWALCYFGLQVPKTAILENHDLEVIRNWAKKLKQIVTKDSQILEKWPKTLHFSQNGKCAHLEPQTTYPSTKQVWMCLKIFFMGKKT
jgi:hypothetical protein